MSQIDITQPHKLTHKKAVAAAQKVADQLAAEYDLECEWDGDVLRFARSGVDGTLEVRADEAQIRIKLGFLLAMFAPKIEEKVAANMKKVFAAKA
ncbi:MAG TPA: polyhydroxyalkanoic acid system family protein [Burkholderiaceae bacterium]